MEEKDKINNENIREVIIEIFKQGDPVEKLPWDSNRLSHKRKEKDKAWKEFAIIPSKENYQNAFSKQNEYEKLKHENRIVKKYYIQLLTIIQICEYTSCNSKCTSKIFSMLILWNSLINDKKVPKKLWMN